ncbi:L,D-transpeptidase [Phaeovulum sp.]|uniref:L,D-transpeptidase n=1 Tax=Phaeovulum sp. TaxID=2934796 RepID=UPI003569FB7F
MLNRRNFVAFGAAASLAACASPVPEAVTRAATAPAALPQLPEFYGPITDEPFSIPAIPEGSLAPEYWRREVANPWPDHKPGTIVVDPDAAILHFVKTPQTAMRYGVSVGAEGFAWEGTARLQFCRKWPRWNVPDVMIARRPELARYSVANGGMAGGLDNPLGARALYLFDNGVDTLYRVHGNAAPFELGKAVSSGCIRMLDHDVIDLHKRAIHGASVIVLASMKPTGLGPVY